MAMEEQEKNVTLIRADVEELHILASNLKGMAHLANFASSNDATLFYMFSRSAEYLETYATEKLHSLNSKED